MTESITIARPYAKALFSSAKAKGNLKEWSERLAYLVLVVNDKQAISYLKDTSLSNVGKVDFLVNLNPSLLQEARSFLEALAQFDRLLLLPEVTNHFEEAKAEHERTAHVRVFTSHEIIPEQLQKLQSALKTRLQKEVALTIEINPELIGGMVIQANDLVIDCSVKGRLQELAKELIA